MCAVKYIIAEKDEKEVGNEFGQNVRDTFPLADLFIAQRENVKEQLERFINLLFGYPYTTPTVHEYGMFHAKATALRSSDLSRQVGAVIATEDGQIIAAGCNEVPKATGGAVWEGSVSKNKDYRDFRRGRDASDLLKHEVIAEIFDALLQRGWMSDKLKSKSSEQLAEVALENKSLEELAEFGLEKNNGVVLRDTRVSNIIEFGRSVHAEMFAITDAARRGVSVKNETLYCTTFPCHVCARHIISSGLKRVVYIEPYPKSMAKDLYERSLCVDGDEADEDAVVFEPFVGIAPTRYFLLFKMAERKDDRGYTIEWDASDAQPRLSQTYPRYLDLETGYEKYLEEHGVEFGLVDPRSSALEGEKAYEEKGLAESPTTRSEKGGGNVESVEKGGDQR